MYTLLPLIRWCQCVTCMVQGCGGEGAGAAPSLVLAPASAMASCRAAPLRDVAPPAVTGTIPDTSASAPVLSLYRWCKGR